MKHIFFSALINPLKIALILWILVPNLQMPLALAGPDPEGKAATGKTNEGEEQLSLLKEAPQNYSVTQLPSCLLHETLLNLDTQDILRAEQTNTQFRSDTRKLIQSGRHHLYWRNKLESANNFSLKRLKFLSQYQPRFLSWKQIYELQDFYHNRSTHYKGERDPFPDLYLLKKMRNKVRQLKRENTEYQVFAAEHPFCGERYLAAYALKTLTVINLVPGVVYLATGDVPVGGVFTSLGGLFFLAGQIATPSGEFKRIRLYFKKSINQCLYGNMAQKSDELSQLIHHSDEILSSIGERFSIHFNKMGARDRKNLKEDIKSLSLNLPRLNKCFKFFCLDEREFPAGIGAAKEEEEAKEEEKIEIVIE